MNSKSVLASVAILALAACGDEPAEEVVAEAPDCPPGIEVDGGWMSMAAVAGDPAAVYFTITNSGDESKMIAAADVAGAASAALHEMGTWNLQPSMDEVLQLDVPAGESVTFEPGGLHVMAMEPGEDLVVGGETEVTLTFVRGDKCSFPAQIRAPGDVPEADVDAE